MISSAAIHNARILIVDDQADVGRLEQVLLQAGYGVLASSMNLRQTSALQGENGYGLLLLDLRMPGMDGAQVVETLKAEDGEGYLPVLAITAEPGDKPPALQAGASDSISKPLDLLEVKARLRNMLEVRLLYKRIGNHDKEPERKVQEPTAELRASEARYRGLTELASDWYWEQDENGTFTKVSGPVEEMLGLQVDVADGGVVRATGWNEEERQVLRAAIAAREPFLDFVFSRINADGSQQKFQVSGEPIFGPACRFLGYRGIGLEITARK